MVFEKDCTKTRYRTNSELFSILTILITHCSERYEDDQLSEHECSFYYTMLCQFSSAGSAV